MRKEELVDITKEIIAEDNHDPEFFPDDIIDKIADAALAFGATEKNADFAIADLVELASDIATDTNLQ